MTKAPTPTEMSKGQSDNTNNGTKQYKKILLLSCTHHFKSDSINNMDHMCISGSQPSSVILCQTMLKSDAQKVPKQAKAKRDSVINPQNYNFNQF